MFGTALPFLKKNRGPRVEKNPPETKTVSNGDVMDEDQELHDHEEIAKGLSSEIMQAMHSADHERFHSAMKAYMDHMSNAPEMSNDEP